jgi:hypothetical protein
MLCNAQICDMVNRVRYAVRVSCMARAGARLRSTTSNSSGTAMPIPPAWLQLVGRLSEAELEFIRRSPIS